MRGESEGGKRQSQGLRVTAVHPTVGWFAAGLREKERAARARETERQRDKHRERNRQGRVHERAARPQRQLCMIDRFLIALLVSEP